MDKIWVKDVKEGEKLKSVFLVARKAVPTAKSGRNYLSVTLHDKTGELEARAFEHVDEFAQAFMEKDYVEVDGQVGTFQGKPQLRVESATKVDAATVEPSEFVWVAPPEPKKPEKPAGGEVEEGLWRDLVALVEALSDPHLKALVQAFLEDDDVTGRLRRAPAAKTVHHAYPGGLLEHTVSCLKLAHRIADHFPQVDRDLLVAGAFFHDLGKIREISFERQFEYSDEGRLIGHHVMTAQWIHDKARRVGVPKDLEHHVVHLVLAHHGKLEYGSPKLPMTLEALLTHEIDELDSRVNSWLNLMGRDGGTRRWTDSNNVYGQHIWRGPLPTVQAEKKGPPPEVMTPVIYVPRETPQQAGRAAQAQAKKKRPERKPEAPRQEASAPAAPAAGAAEARAEGAPAPAPTEARAEQHERPPRPEKPDRAERGAFRGPSDRKRGYTGPRLPGDRGPQPRQKPAAGLTHNPFAALAQKIEGAPAEPAAAAPTAEPEAAAPPTEPTSEPVTASPESEAPSSARPETTAAPGVEEASPGEAVPAREEP
jgi:3'-5' exoribonuclease